MAQTYFRKQITLAILLQQVVMAHKIIEISLNLIH